MKKQTIVTVLAATVLAIALTACGSTPASATKAAPKELSGVPAFVNAAYMQASEDMLVGIGAYKIGTDLSWISTGKTFAETRARADISRQLRTIMQNMITDYTAQSELDPKAALSFQENITRALSQADLRGSKTVAMDTQDGVLWVVMEYSKSLAANDYSAAQAAARLAVPAAAAFDALKRMDNAFDKLAGGGPIPVTE
ncbi:MAG: hypothetical protein LBB72_05370 [Spirochaetaceae bacterium]|jgi:hypothetical protein|nr:hypothetical protein [Spirochaetaceae bacterium]